MSRAKQDEGGPLAQLGLAWRHDLARTCWVVMSAPITVLVVDDDDVDVMAIQRAFRTHNLANPIVVAHDGMDALALLRSNAVVRPYVIVLDLNMPCVDGIEFLDQLRADPDHGSAVVFTLTTSANERDRLAAYKRNVAGYIVKSGLSGDMNEFVSMLTGFFKIVAMP
jgi:CheY-like chemotaxis protein